jgi:transposase-like protein
MKMPDKKPGSYSSMSLLEFQQVFHNEKACYEFLFHQFWPNGFSCHQCQGTKTWFLPSRTIFECAGCGQQISLTAGTLFQKSKVPLHLWFWVIFLMATDKKGCSALKAQRLLGIGSYKTAWLMTHKIRDAMQQRDSNYRLAGTIEVDESYYGKRDRGGKRARGTRKVPVFIASENREGKPGFAAMRVLKNLEQETINKAVKQVISEGSHLRSDGSASYNSVGEEGHTREAHAMWGDRTKNDRVLPWVHVLASNSKRFLLSTHHGIAKKYLSRYLGEFIYRYNRRQWADQLFERLLFACLTAEPVTKYRLILNTVPAISV